MKRTQIVYKRWRFLRLTCLWEYFKHHHQPHKGKWCSLIIMACEKDDSRSRCEFNLLLFPRSVACSGESLETSKNAISVVNCSKILMVIGGILAPSSSITSFQTGSYRHSFRHFSAAQRMTYGSSLTCVHFYH